MDDVFVFEYSSKDLQEKGCKWSEYYKNGKNLLTLFDQLLMKKWNEALVSGMFKYTLDECQFKVLPNEWDLQFVAQLNIQRGFNRRKHELFDDMNAAFSEKQFNFTKIDSAEILFTIKPNESTSLAAYDREFCASGDHAVVVNVSPIDDCHILLIPELNKCLKQKMTVASLLLAFDLVQLSGHPGFRVGFNSLHAWASVNHLHYHAMYFNYPIFLDNFPAVKHLKSNCFLLDDFAMRGLVFNIPSASEKRIMIAKEAINITDLLHEKIIPFNVMITRGDPGTRLVIFPRKSVKDREKSPCFDVACVEIGGQFPIKTKEEFDSLTFERAYSLLEKESLTQEEFSKLSDQIITLL